MNIFTWVALFVASIIVYLAVARQTGFKLMTSSNGVPRFGSLSGVLTMGKLGPGIANWWKNIDRESSPGQRFFLLCVVVLVAYIEFHMGTKVDPVTNIKTYGHVWFALGILLVAAMYSPPKEWYTKAFLVFDLIVIILASFFPAVAEMRTTSADIANTWFTKKATAMKQYADDYKNDRLQGSSPGSTSPASSAKTDQQNGATSIVVEVPTDSSVVTTAPLGYRLSSMECPTENVVEIVEPASKTVLRQIDCADTIRLTEHEIRNMEFVIFQKPGATQPSHVTTWWKKG